jgi:hypothetical protein
MVVPVPCRLLDRFDHLCPGLKTASFEGQGAERFPPRLNEVEIGRILWLKDKLPTWVGVADKTARHRLHDGHSNCQQWRRVARSLRGPTPRRDQGSPSSQRPPALPEVADFETEHLG